MIPLLKRIIAWFLVTVVILAGGWWAWGRLADRRDPHRTWARRMLEERLGAMTPKQREVADRALERDSLLAVLVAYGSYDAIGDLGKFIDAGSTKDFEVAKLVLQAGFRHELDGPNAERLVNDLAAKRKLVGDVFSTPASPSEHPSEPPDLFGEFNRLPMSEYQNVAYDVSYLLIAPRIGDKRRAIFRDNQDILTPILAAADPSEWNRLLDSFSQAMPRVAQIFRSDDLGPIYGMIYLLNARSIEDLKAVDISERDAIDFVGVNAAAMREGLSAKIDLAQQVKDLRSTKAEDGKTLFDWACIDQALFWMMVHAQTTAKIERPATALDNAVTVTQRYAGTVLPLILTRYATAGDGHDKEQNDKCFQAALHALVRFDNYDTKETDPKHSSAAMFLSAYQNDDTFKVLLAKHGARLIPAVGAGGRKVLNEIQKNPNDIDKYVTRDGKSVGKPLWTWLPGGSIAFVIREKVGGRTVDWADWVWAGTDVAIFYSIGKIARGGLGGLWRIIGGVVKEEGPRVIVKKIPAATARLIEREAAEMVDKSVVREGSAIMFRNAFVFLKNAGVKTARIGSGAVGKLLAFAVHKPIITAAVLCVIFPDRANAVIDRAAEGVGRIITSAPGSAIKGVWEKAQDLANEQPLTAWLFYLLAAALTCIILFMPLILLRLLLPNVYKLIAGWLRGTVRAAGTGVRALFRVFRHNRARPVPDAARSQPIDPSEEP